MPNPKKIGGYSVRDEIGSGEFGAVYRAREEWDDYEVAIKALNERCFPDAEAAERFRRDADALSDIDHPNIAGVHKYGESGDFRYVVMDIMSGSLRETLDSGGKMSLSRAVDICRQAALGLKAAHDVGVVHRDVNPKNIMFDSDGVVKVSDFGLERADYPPAMALDGAPMAGGIYASPERMSGGRADARSDIYSLGAVLYETLAGRTPVWGESLARLRPNAPTALRTAVGKCLEPDPENRYQTMDELIQALSPALVNRCALVDFYEAAGGHNWRRSDNWLTDKPLDEWRGVTADGDGFVTEIDFGDGIFSETPANNMEGEMPREIAYLTKLERLDIEDNNLSGILPPELGGLAELKRLDLSGNQFSGNIPPELGGLAKLTWLDLNGNDFSGNAPPELGGLTKLTWLNLRGNELSGSVPPELGGLAELEHLDLSGNQFSRSVPPELGGLTKLTWLNLSDNRLSGSVPPELGGLTKLRLLFLNRNRLSGSVPPELGGLTELIDLRLGGNDWTGVMPKALFDVLDDDMDSISLPVRVSDPARLLRSASPLSLREIMADGRLSLSTSVDVFRQVALELRAAGERGDVRLDVNPDSVLLDSAGRVEVAGSAGDAPRYWSPERWKGERADVRSAVYSLGITLHEMLTGSGEAPFGAAGESPLKRMRPGVPNGLARIVEKCAELDPRRRFRTMDELVESVSLDLVNRCALTDLYEALDGDNWSRKRNWLTDEPLDSWEGVTANRDGVVTGFSDSRIYGLKGELPSEIARLTGLKSLEVDSYGLSGVIPPEIGELTELKRLVIRGSKISGVIPPEIGELTKLKRLDLSANELSGDIPPELGGLANLKRLNLSANDELSGNIPPELGGLAKLKELYLSDNRLSGNIPPELGGLTELRRLHISDNRLSGSVPPELGGLAKLKWLYLNDNRLSGSVPPELGGLAKLEWLDLSDNRLSGSVPPELGGLAKLEWLDLSDNRLSGSVPPELGGLAKLKLLDLSDNRLSGSAPPELGGLAKLFRLNLNGNRLSGSAPPELGGLAKLEWLDLSDNRLSGNISPELGGLTKLRVLSLELNWLSGSVPPEIGGLAKLSELDLSDNRLSGSVPPELGGLAKLYELDLSDNRLSGSVPPELGELAKLYRLDLSDNRLSGNIPPELGGLAELERLDIGGNNWTGCIPRALFDIPRSDLDKINLPVCDRPKIGGYGVLGEIASGGSGAVYRARDTLNDRDVALKILPHADDPDDLARFLQEARLARAINHPNVIDVFDCGEDGGVRFIAMELTPTSLREILAKGRLSLSRALDIFRQAALGLRAVHERGGVHGDVKPGGILLDSAGAVKMAGFGSARADDSRTITAPGSVLGAPFYMSPERWKGESADVRSDVYSLGAILYEALTGEAPAVTPGKAKVKRIRPSVPADLARIVEKCANLAPSRRYQTMDELIDAVSMELVNRCALIDFYEATNGDGWKRNGNWLADDEPLDNWYGVTANRDGVVVGLELDWNSMEGELPLELGGLAELKRLNLSYNRLSGNIPPELTGSLTKLERLDLSANRLSGSVPPELGGLAKLEYLTLRRNRLSGNIPPELGGLTELEYLALSGNRLFGDIPSELAGLTELAILDLESNGLSGVIPPELGGLPELERLDLSYNRLSGSIPPELASPAKLRELHLGDNGLWGGIPTELASLAELRELALGGNRLFGAIPPELGSLTELRELHLGGNRLFGAIPPELGGLAKLENLHLGDNRLLGNIPPELGGLAELGSLNLSGNLLSGSVPPELGGLTELHWLDLSDNRLSGNIPPELGGLPELRFLGLDDNRLSGSVPPELGGLTELKCLHLDGNRLSGNIPPELGGMPELRILHLEGNDWTGCIPKALLDISSNNMNEIDLPVCDD